MENLQKFTGDHGWNQYVQEVDGFICATNGFMILRKKGNLTERPTTLISDNDAKYLKSLFEKSTNREHSYKTSYLKIELDKFRNKPVYKKTTETCGSCGGDGVVDWEFEHYTREFDCPVCDGYGQTETKKVLTRQGFYEYDLVKLSENTKLKADFIYSLLNISEVITFKETEGNIVLFFAGEYSGLIMKHTGDNVVLDLTN